MLTQKCDRWLLTVAFTAGSILLAACGGDSKDLSSPPSGAAGIDIQTLLDNADVDQTQRDILADGAVDRAELERSLSNEAQCLDGLGFDASWEFINKSRFIYTVLNRPGNTGDSGAAEQDCSAKYSDVVQIVWATQNARTPTQQADYEQSIIDCLKSKGITVKDYTAAQNMTDIDSFVACEQIVEASA
jgi:glycerophosphoryl diester phosphodiesterase